MKRIIKRFSLLESKLDREGERARLLAEKRAQQTSERLLGEALDKSFFLDSESKLYIDLFRARALGFTCVDIHKLYERELKSIERALYEKPKRPALGEQIQWQYDELKNMLAVEGERINELMSALANNAIRIESAVESEKPYYYRIEREHKLVKLALAQRYILSEYYHLRRASLVFHVVDIYAGSNERYFMRAYELYERPEKESSPSEPSTYELSPALGVPARPTDYEAQRFMVFARSVMEHAQRGRALNQARALDSMRAKRANFIPSLGSAHQQIDCDYTGRSIFDE